MPQPTAYMDRQFSPQERKLLASLSSRRLCEFLTEAWAEPEEQRRDAELWLYAAGGLRGKPADRQVDGRRIPGFIWFLQSGESIWASADGKIIDYPGLTS